MKYLKLLDNFWPEFTSWTAAAGAVPVREVVDELDAALSPMLFPLKVWHLHSLPSNRKVCKSSMPAMPLAAIMADLWL